MKKIINGRRYDTEAKHTREIARADWGYAGDFDAYNEGLFRTSHGNWFVAGEGGPNTKYCRPAEGGGYGGGPGLFELTPEQAMDWLEHHSETDLIEEYFGAEVEDA
jgi:hypothetical protein